MHSLHTGLTFTPRLQLINDQIKSLDLEMWQTEINLMARMEGQRGRERWRERGGQRVRVVETHEKEAAKWKLLSADYLIAPQQS